jgi:hypothetical protein
MTKTELFASAQKQAENVAKLHTATARKAQIKAMLATLLMGMKHHG